MGLAFLRCICGAYASTCSAVDASFCIDNVLVFPFADSLYRALVYTSSTVDAFVADYISHSNTSFIVTSFHADYSKRIFNNQVRKIEIFG